MPPEVEKAIDARSSMGAIGDLNAYVKYQMGAGMTQGGEGAAAAAVPAQMAIGFGIAQEMMKNMQPGAAAAQPAAATAAAAVPGLEVLTPEQAAQALGVAVEDVMAAIDAGELKARRIGSATRIAREALQAFLRGE